MSKPDFVDGFAISTNNVTGDTAFTFYTTWTDFNDDNQPAERKEEVSKIVMSYGGVKTFLERLKKSIDDYEKVFVGE